LRARAGSAQGQSGHSGNAAQGDPAPDWDFGINCQEGRHKGSKRTFSAAHEALRIQ